MPETSDRRGWVKIHRELIDSKLWSCSDATLRVALYLILEANHEPHYVRRLLIEPGQTVRSLTRIADDCHVSRKAVRHAIKILHADGFIVLDEPFGAQQGHRLTICKYDTYQAPETERGTQRAHEGPNAGSNEGNTNKNGENEEEGEEIHTPRADASWTIADYVRETRNLLPEYANLNESALMNAVRNESDPQHRANAWNDYATAVLGSLKTPENPGGMLAAYMKNARTKGGQRPGNRKLNAMEVDF